MFRCERLCKFGKVRKHFESVCGAIAASVNRRIRHANARAVGAETDTITGTPIAAFSAPSQLISAGKKNDPSPVTTDERASAPDNLSSALWRPTSSRKQRCRLRHSKGPRITARVSMLSFWYDGRLCIAPMICSAELRPGR